MHNRKGFQLVGVIIGLVVVALIAVAAYFVIDGNSKATDFTNYDFFSIIEADNSNGSIADHVKGDPNAPVIIYEYADYYGIRENHKVPSPRSIQDSKSKI